MSQESYFTRQFHAADSPQTLSSLTTASTESYEWLPLSQKDYSHQHWSYIHRAYHVQRPCLILQAWWNDCQLVLLHPWTTCQQLMDGHWDKFGGDYQCPLNSNPFEANPNGDFMKRPSSSITSKQSQRSWAYCLCGLVVTVPPTLDL